MIFQDRIVNSGITGDSPGIAVICNQMTFILLSTVAPMALFSIGMQLRFDGWRKELLHISAALLYKLMIAPALVLLLAVTAGFSGEIAAVSIFESSMPSFVTAGIIASQYQLNAKLSTLVVAVSILVSFITTALWYWVIGFL
ncbi:MAG: AEC family transporter [Chitinophagaceae bacterium]|nr:AEC family transporter [Chitinophagaceae bacterium]MCW5928355.1 AEC family transporter [Chitinophagaceae bacterium]